MIMNQMEWMFTRKLEFIWERRQAFRCNLRFWRQNMGYFYSSCYLVFLHILEFSYLFSSFIRLLFFPNSNLLLNEVVYFFLQFHNLSHFKERYYKYRCSARLQMVSDDYSRNRPKKRCILRFCLLHQFAASEESKDLLHQHLSFGQVLFLLQLLKVVEKVGFSAKSTKVTRSGWVLVAFLVKTNLTYI